MRIDVLLPSTLLLITVAILFLYIRYEGKVRSLVGGRELRPRDAVLLVAAMGVMVTILALIPKLDIILVLFLGIYSLVLFLFTYLVVPKWYLAVLTPALFIILYFYYWNMYLLNFFAIIFAIFISIYLGSLFTWKTTAAFVALLTIMDIVQVLVTGFMGVSSQKMIELGLPVMIIIPTFPSEGQIGLGLGDIFFFGLLIIQTTQKYGRRFGLASVLIITAVFLIFETIQLNFVVRYLPATVFVTCGWLTALGARHIYKSRVFSAG